MVHYYRLGDQNNSTSASEIFEKCLTINFITTYPYIKQDLVFSVKLHLGLTLYPFGGRRLLVEDDLRWKTTFGEDDLLWKMTFSGDNLWWKTTFGGRQPSV